MLRTNNGAADPDLAPLENADRATSEALYNQATGSSLADWGSWFSGASMSADRWDGKIVGQAYVDPAGRNDQEVSGRQHV